MTTKPQGRGAIRRLVDRMLGEAAPIVPEVPDDGIPEDADIVPVSAACYVTAHVANGKVVLLTVGASEFEIEDDRMTDIDPAPSPEAVQIVKDAIENGTLPPLTLDEE